MTADDCDDSDISMPTNDMDCDGVPTADDCDDGDSDLTQTMMRTAMGM